MTQGKALGFWMPRPRAGVKGRCGTPPRWTPGVPTPFAASLVHRAPFLALGAPSAPRPLTPPSGMALRNGENDAGASFSRTTGKEWIWLKCSTLVHLLAGPLPQPMFFEQGQILGDERLGHSGEQRQLLG